MRIWGRSRGFVASGGVCGFSSDFVNVDWVLSLVGARTSLAFYSSF